jgi:arylsulfatase A-like enzyme
MDLRKWKTAGGVLMLASLCLLPGCGRQSPAVDTPVLLVTVDTLRADHLGCYGGRRPTSPHLDRLARSGHLFLDALCPMPTTTPAHAALFTGRHPRSIGVLSNGAVLPQNAVTLAELLEDRGYVTAAFVGGYPVHARFGFDQGFQTYSSTELAREANTVVDEAIDWLAGRDGKPFFLWVHLWDPHTPYYAPEEYRDRFQVPSLELPLKFAFIRHPDDVTEEMVEKTVAAYDAEIAWTDLNLGRLLAAMKRHGHFQRSLIAVTADHGESMAELLRRRAYAFDHGEFLYRHQLAVPLLIRPPGGPLSNDRTRHHGPVSLIDLMPTLLELLDLKAPGKTEGRSLLPLMAGGTLPHRAVIAQRRPFFRPAKPFLAGEQYSVTSAGWHLITSTGDSPELFDLASDPGEKQNRFADQEAVVRQMLELLHAWQEGTAAPPAGGPPDLDPVVRERLRALGYTE